MRTSSTLYITAIIIAGEAIFSLPFLVQRVFRPTLLELCQIDNYQLGVAFSYYGVVALLCYLLGGPIADRYSPRALMASALVATGLGGFVFLSFPKGLTLKLLFAYWGVTTILTFWAAMIKATKRWGGDRSQGLAFGILDGGRGLAAAALASVALYLFSRLLPEDPAAATLAQKEAALQTAIGLATAFTFAAAILVYLVLPGSEPPAQRAEAEPPGDGAQRSKGSPPATEGTIDRVLLVLRNPLVWLQGCVVIAAYCCYKSIDNLGLFVRDALQFNDLEAAGVSSLALWLRPLAALGVGLLGDRIGALRGLAGCFSLLCLGYAAMGAGVITPERQWLLWLLVVETGVMVFGLRGLYFAILKENNTPPELVGTAVGVISIIGYLPDIFMGPMMGAFNRAYPGALGHEYLYLTLALIAALGLGATLGFQRKMSRSFS